MDDVCVRGVGNRITETRKWNFPMEPHDDALGLIGSVSHWGAFFAHHVDKASKAQETSKTICHTHNTPHNNYFGPWRLTLTSYDSEKSLESLMKAPSRHRESVCVP